MSTDSTQSDKKLCEELDSKYILGALCVKAPDHEVRDCLRQYDPKFTLKQLTKTFMKSSKDVIVKLAKFLVINVDVMLKPDKTKPKLIHLIICKVQNLLPDTCQICKEDYVSKLGDDPFLPCEICGQEAHKPCYMKLLGMTDPSVIPNFNPHKLPGVHYLCKSCEDSTIPIDRGSELNTNQCDEEELDVLEPSQQDNSLSITQSVIEIPTPSEDVNESLPSQNDPDISNSSQTAKSSSPPANDKNSKLKNKICPFYRKNNCRHGKKGSNCPFLHPERCQKLLLYGSSQPKGCNLGKKCTHYHPKMCPTSITKRECFDDKCNFTHVKGTKRKPVASPSKSSGQRTGIKDPPTPPKATNSDDDLSSNPSFLSMMSLIKKELIEALDSKIATVISQLPQFNPGRQGFYQSPFQPPMFPTLFPPTQAPPVPTKASH